MSYFTLTIPKTTALFGNCFSISLNWIILSYLIIFCVGLGRTVGKFNIPPHKLPVQHIVDFNWEKEGNGRGRILDVIEVYFKQKWLRTWRSLELKSMSHLTVFFLSPDRTQYRRILVRAQVIVEFNTVVASSLAKDNGCNMAFYIEQDWDRKTIIRKV